MQEIQKDIGLVGGIIGYIAPFNNNTFECDLKYCYNTGNITGTGSGSNQNIGSIAGFYKYIDADYIYTLEKETDNKPIFGGRR